MNSYVAYLLEDIAEAHRDEPFVENFPEERIREVERYINPYGYEQTLAYFCGLSIEQFPPANQLNTEEMQLIITAFKEMTFSWNHLVDFPDNLPIEMEYELIIRTLNKKTLMMNYGYIHFDNCTGNAPECVFKEFCPCLIYWQEYERQAVNK